MQQVDLLLVEDNEQLAFVVETAAEMAGISVLHAGTASQALEYLGSYSPRVILLDLMLPDLDGVEVARRLRADPHLMHIPIVLWSAYVDSPILRDNRYLFDRIVAKPGARVAEFLESLRVYLQEPAPK